MGYARNRPKLLPEKLRLIREHLQLDHAHMPNNLRQRSSHTFKSVFSLKHIGFHTLRLQNMSRILSPCTAMAAYRK